MNNEPSKSMDKKSKTPTAEFLDYIEIFVFSVCAVMLIFSFFIRVCRVDGPSMNNTLVHNEILITRSLGYEPQQNDIIVFHQTNNKSYGFNEPIVKRVIAVGGQYVKIDFKNALVYVSEDPAFDHSDILNEKEYIYLDNDRYNMSGTLETYVPEGKVFVMGDNRNHSSDSRSSEIGLVDTRRVLGKVILRLFPFDRFTIFN